MKTPTVTVTASPDPDNSSVTVSVHITLPNPDDLDERVAARELGSIRAELAAAVRAEPAVQRWQQLRRKCEAAEQAARAAEAALRQEQAAKTLLENDVPDDIVTLLRAKETELVAAVAARYTADPDFRTLYATEQTARSDETARLVLADWVQDRGDDAEAAAIRDHISEAVDLAPALARTASALVVSCAALLKAYTGVLPTVSGSGVEAIVSSLAGIMGAMEPPVSEGTQG